MSEQLAKSIATACFPKRCPYCRKTIHKEQYACSDCIENFPAAPIRGDVIGGYPCVSSFMYKDEYRSAVFRFKFRNKKQYGRSFAVSIAYDILKVYNDIKFDCITAVPMHRNKLIERDYNQAEVLARAIGSILGIEYIETLEQFKEKRDQHDLGSNERAENVSGIYRLNNGVKVKGKTVLLCDDIVTTGHTLGACAKVLVKAGAKEIYCATILKR